MKQETDRTKWRLHERHSWGWDVTPPEGVNPSTGIRPASSAAGAEAYCEARNEGASHSEALDALRVAGGYFRGESADAVRDNLSHARQAIRRRAEAAADPIAQADAEAIEDACQISGCEGQRPMRTSCMNAINIRVAADRRDLGEPLTENDKALVELFDKEHPFEHARVRLADFLDAHFETHRTLREWTSEHELGGKVVAVHLGAESGGPGRGGMIFVQLWAGGGFDVYAPTPLDLEGTAAAILEALKGDSA